MSKSVNWGFMGTAKISKINAPAAVSANSCIVAVAGRDATRVEEWLDDMMPELTAAAAHEKLALPKRPLSFTGYDALLSADAAATAPSASSGTTAGGAASDSALRVSSIQAVYIPIPTAKDVEWVIAVGALHVWVVCRACAGRRPAPTHRRRVCAHARMRRGFCVTGTRRIASRPAGW